MEVTSIGSRAPQNFEWARKIGRGCGTLREMGVSGVEEVVLVGALCEE
jgi:hypothetical protein